MARTLITDYGMLMKAIGNDFKTNDSLPCSYTRAYNLIGERYGESYAKKVAVVPVYEYRLNITGTLINYLYLIDIRADENGNRDMVIRDGVYIYDDYNIAIINIDCTALFKENVDYTDVAGFFDGFRKSISNFFIDTLLRPTDSIFLTYFGAFCAIHSVFDVDKDSMIEIQQYMNHANRAVEKDNTIYENMLALYNAGTILYLHVCRAYEDGMRNDLSNSVPVTKIVPSVQEGND